MTDRLEVRCRMFPGRVVAAADVTAFLADAEMYPIVPSGGDALDAAGSRRSHVKYLVEMLADVDHVGLLAARSADTGIGSANVVNSLRHPISVAAPS